jgi:hypothetical protein
MMDYKKLKRLFKDGEYQFIDALINVDLDLISKIDPMMIKKNFAKHENGKYKSLLTQRELELFTTVKIIANGHIRFLINALSTVLHDKQDAEIISRLEKECEALKSVIDVKDLEIERNRVELTKTLPEKLREQGAL